MIDGAVLLGQCRGLVSDLVDDLRLTADAEVVSGEYASAVGAGRTSLSQQQWAEGLFAQVAVSWVLGCVFVRFCEDNALVDEVLLSGPGERRALAIDQRSEYLRRFPAHDDRHWLREVFTRYRALPATGDIFGGHNPLWLLDPSADAARLLVQRFQAIDPESGALLHDFTDPTWDTRFLGDLYQDLSDHAKKQFALLQTPVFVEEFILDRTLEPAIKTFGLADADVIDPTCGSGHFLLGAFARLFNHWVEAEPGVNRRELAQRALDQVAGVDVNPFAAAIARFRLLVAALRAGGDSRLIEAPAYRINVAVGDSLLHSQTQLVLEGMGVDDDEMAAAAAHGYSTEDREAVFALLNRRWAAVVGNPPYITVKDPALSALYRKRYPTCRGKYSLGVPFTERFWQLAREEQDRERAGFVGMITANSFMKREMGKKLIEEWFPSHDLTHLVDTSGAYIPGHGTPTVILFGRARRPVSETVRAVLGIRGEPSTPADASKGLVWTDIVEHLDHPGSETDFVSVTDLPRQRLHQHPWSIGGGGASELKERLDASAVTTLGLVSASIGFGAISAADEVFRVPTGTLRRSGVEQELQRSQVFGEDVRNWSIEPASESLFPYSDGSLLSIEQFPRALRWLWPLRTTLWARRTFNKQTYRQEGRTWWEWHQVVHNRAYRLGFICFPHVATHNNFALTVACCLFNSSAPVADVSSLPADRQLAITGALNSSIGCFWMKQVFHNKGNGGIGGGIGDEDWEPRYDHDGTKLQSFPLPPVLPGVTASELDVLAQRLLSVSPAVLVGDVTPTVEVLGGARSVWEQTRREMIGLQEQLDWECYRLYGLIDDELTMAGGEPPVGLGERAFEIVMARKMAAGELNTAWFDRHGSTPRTDLPEHWSEEYRALVQRRIDVIESNPQIGLIERPEYKRRWNTTPWDEQQRDALRSWLLDHLESPAYWTEVAVSSVARLASRARTDVDFMSVATLYTGRDDFDVATLVAELVTAEAVPYLAAMRLKESGMRKWVQWCETWDLQRREDAGEDVGEIPVPPKYSSADFMAGVWPHRGKLDVPKERFISYPGAQTDSDPSLVIGWAGWDHAERARALASWYLQSKSQERDREVLVPMLAGLAELLPWLEQWHNEPSADPVLNRPADQVRALWEAEMRANHVTAEDLAQWRPTTTTRRKRSTT